MNGYLGIDASYSGLAIVLYVPQTGDHTASVGDFSKVKYGHGVTRLTAISRYVDGVLTGFDAAADITHVAMEGYAFGARNGRELAGELAATIKTTLYTHYPPDICYPTIVQPTAVKKFCTGKGGSPKNVMLKTILSKWGGDFGNDNIGDAYVLARIASHRDRPAQFKYEQEVLDELTWHTEKPVLRNTKAA